MVTHLGEVAELAEEGGLHRDVRGRDAPEQVEHRLEDGHAQRGVEEHDLLQRARRRRRDAVVGVDEGAHEEAAPRGAVDDEVARDAARVEEGEHAHRVAVQPAPLLLVVAARGVGVLELRLVLRARQRRLVAQQRPVGRGARVRGPQQGRVEREGARLLAVVRVVPAAHVGEVEHVVVLVALLGQRAVVHGEPEQHRLGPCAGGRNGRGRARRGGRELPEVRGEGRLPLLGGAQEGRLHDGLVRSARPGAQPERRVPQADALQAHLLVRRAKDVLDVRREPGGDLALHPGEALAALGRGGAALGELALHVEDRHERAHRGGGVRGGSALPAELQEGEDELLDRPRDAVGRHAHEDVGDGLDELCGVGELGGRTGHTTHAGQATRQPG